MGPEARPGKLSAQHSLTAVIYDHGLGHRWPGMVHSIARQHGLKYDDTFSPLSHQIARPRDSWLGGGCGDPVGQRLVPRKRGDKGSGPGAWIVINFSGPYSYSAAPIELLFGGLKNRELNPDGLTTGKR